ncbi:hypothetical protein [Lysobacter panacisoli]|nr:hypothetical protein [Lysobacter panacisoli]
MGTATAEARGHEAPTAQDVAGLADTQYESSLRIEDAQPEARPPTRDGHAFSVASTGVFAWLSPLAMGTLRIPHPAWLIVGVLLLLGLIALCILLARRFSRRGDEAVVEAEAGAEADEHKASESRSAPSDEHAGVRVSDAALTESLLLAPARDVTVNVPTSWQPSLSPVVRPSWGTTPSRQTTAASPQPESKLFLDEDNPDATVRMARTALSTGMPARAAELLTPLLKRTDVSNKTLMAAGGILQDIAIRSDEHGECYGLAADAFARVLELEPQRQALQRRIGQCRLEQARRLSAGPQRSRLFSEAAERLGLAAEAGGADIRLLADLGTAQAQCVALSNDASGPTAYINAVVPLRAAMEAGAEEDSDAAWQLQDILRQQAQSEQGDQGASRHAEASAIIRRALSEGTQAARRPLWQATAIDAAIESMRMKNPNAAARRTRLREIRARFAPIMKGDVAPVLVSAWVELLCTEADGLVGSVAIEKYQEAEARLSDAMRSNHEDLSLAVSASRVARRKAARQAPLARLATLRNAQQRLLKPYANRVASSEALQFERVANTIEQAPLLRMQASREMYAQALEWAEPLAHSPRHEAKAMQYCLDATLALDAVGEHDLMADRLLGRARADAGAMLVVARYFLERGNLAKAAESCEAAWRSGAPKSVLVPLWQNVVDAAASNPVSAAWLDGSCKHLVQARNAEGHVIGVGARRPGRIASGDWGRDARSASVHRAG